MNAEIFETSDEPVIIGMPLRTNPQSAQEEIPAFWQRVMDGPDGARLPKRDGDARLYAAYCDYETDGTQSFTMVVGYEVAPGQPVPEGMRRVTVPRGRYARFPVEGDPSQVFWRIWGFINEEWDGKKDRRYAVDYERYAPESRPTFVRAEVVVGLR